MGAQMATTCQFACVDTLTRSFIKFHIWTTFIKILCISEYGPAAESLSMENLIEPKRGYSEACMTINPLGFN